MSSNDGNPAPTNKIIIMYPKIKKKKRIENKLSYLIYQNEPLN